MAQRRTTVVEQEIVSIVCVPGRCRCCCCCRRRDHDRWHPTGSGFPSSSSSCCDPDDIEHRSRARLNPEEMSGMRHQMRMMRQEKMERRLKNRTREGGRRGTRRRQRRRTEIDSPPREEAWSQQKTQTSGCCCPTIPPSPVLPPLDGGEEHHRHCRCRCRCPRHPPSHHPRRRRPLVRVPDRLSRHGQGDETPPDVGGPGRSGACDEGSRKSWRGPGNPAARGAAPQLVSRLGHCPDSPGIHIGGDCGCSWCGRLAPAGHLPVVEHRSGPRVGEDSGIPGSGTGDTHSKYGTHRVCTP